ncbi:hypothetical protein HRQ91_01185 [Treponema parvum]|uniref:Uncharacterized protein n=1 Tax=Treponema parvum TaxID=138851 RepID=A0A975F2I4_9SPIR|nr:hypothetical protein [Treponema parvum]QTQ13178.1 hypothetical protein HRQ91_01185 [Treponema parvum]
MHKLIVKKDNVSLRPFLYLQDKRNKSQEFSNTTVCNYFWNNYRDIFHTDYKDRKSFQSGYAGNFSLIFDSSESQEGKTNKFTKEIPPELKKIIPKLYNLQIDIRDDYCYIGNIPDGNTFRILSVFFCLKRINAKINDIVDIREKKPDNSWKALLAKKLNCKTADFPANRLQQTGRGDIGRKSTLNRYTIYNMGNNWFDVIKPNYYNFKNLRYKILLHNLMIEQSNVYFCIIKSKFYNFDYNDVFKDGIDFDGNGEPQLVFEWINQQIILDDVILVKKDDLRDLILEKLEVPTSYQYTFNKIEDNTLFFDDGTQLDLNSIVITKHQTLIDSQNFNPNITFNKELENELCEKAKDRMKNVINQGKHIVSRISKGEESNTIKKFLDLSHDGLLKIKDYHRITTDDSIVTGKEKTCLIIYNGTKYPDLICVFLEDAERIEKKGNRTIIEYSNYIEKNASRFKHIMFEVEAEFNLTSFGDHDTTKTKVLLSKYVFCENASSGFYESQFGIKIPVISIKDFSNESS